jgi:hypothetical protein
MDRNTKWSGVAVAALIAGAANGGDRGQFQITPYLGNARVKVDGAHREFGESQTYDQWIAGISAAYRAPFGLVFEIGRADTGEPIFGWFTGGEVLGPTARWVMTSIWAGAGTSPRSSA